MVSGQKSYTLGQIHRSLKTQHPLQTPRQQSSRSHPTWWWASLEKREKTMRLIFDQAQEELASRKKPKLHTNGWKNSNIIRFVTHASFQINREPIWHIDHLEPLLNLLVKLHLPQVFTLTGLRAKHTKSPESKFIRTDETAADNAWTAGFLIKASRP